MMKSVRKEDVCMRSYQRSVAVASNASDMRAQFIIQSDLISFFSQLNKDNKNQCLILQIVFLVYEWTGMMF